MTQRDEERDSKMAATNGNGDGLPCLNSLLQALINGVCLLSFLSKLLFFLLPT